MNFNMYKIILTLNNHKVIVTPTEKTEVHQKLTFNLENELLKYFDYLKVYLEDRLSKLGKKIHWLYLFKGNRS